MKRTLIYPAGITEACVYAAQELRGFGIPLTDHPEPEITHILLDVPSIRGSHTEASLTALLSMIPQSATIIGGNLDHSVFSGYRRLDLLKDADYLAQNAAITAECALQIAASHLKTTFADSPALILGWGRIGKCLGRLLTNLNCPTTIAARKESDRAMIRALGYESISYESLPHMLDHYRILFNTVPATIISQKDLSTCQNCAKIELASQNGLIGEDVILARGLPGTYAPISSGKLIAQTCYRHWKEETQ